MQPGVLLLLAICVGVALLGAVTAEYGPESEDGWPINVDGVVVRPPVDPVSLQLDLIAFPGPLNKVGPVTAYPYYPILTAELTRLATDYPHLVRMTSAGKSVAGLDVWALEIADFENPDMKPLAEREVVYIDGGIHSNEYSGVYFVTEVAQFLIEEYETNATARWVVENRHTWIVPMVNPDGSHVFGRMNANWVNLNRNFPYTWGELEEDFLMNNPGPSPASEPETRIVIEFIDRLMPDYFASIHCCGNLWLHPWGAEHLADPIDMEMFSRICDELFADVRERCGPIWSTIYPAVGSSVEEAYGRVGSAAWGFEMSGRGALAAWGQPVIIEDVRVQERESWGAVMHAFLNVERYGAHPELVRIAGDAETLAVTVQNTGWGPLVAGNLTMGGHRIPLGGIGSGNTTTILVPGPHAAGEVSVTLEWTKRLHAAPQGEKRVAVVLVEENGALVGVFDGAADPTPTGSEMLRDTPAPWPLLVLVGLVAVLTTTRRIRS